MPRLVLGHPSFQVVGVPGIEHAAAAMEHVGPERHCLPLRKKPPFDKLRADGIENVMSCSQPHHPHFPIMGEGKVITGALEGGQRLDKALAEASGLSRERIKALIGEGKVTLGGKPVTQASGKVANGARFAIEVPPPADPKAAPEEIPLSVVHEDEHLIVIDKPAGMVVHPAAGNPAGTLVNALLHHCRGRLSGIGGVARPGIVHRIDKDTSGLLVVAKSDAAHEGLARQFADHSIKRVYLALVNGHPNPSEGTVRGRIGRSDANRKKMTVLPNDSSRGKHAVTHYKVLERMEHCSLVECRLETGRTHQVRVHLASIGHALLGDPQYGRPNQHVRPILQRLGFHRQALHAAVLGFVHPITSDTLRFTSDLPSDMRELIDETGHSNR
jgi:23S rRNA pseudouridine1911/1915/1917 synthase